LVARSKGNIRGVKSDRRDHAPGPPGRLVERAAAAEINARRVNEAIERGTGAAGTAVFVCECGHLGCNATVEMTIAAYECVRSDFDRFLVAPGHEIEEIEEVVERHPGYLVVAKRALQAVAMARATDGREHG
jgi:hypothetical protein